MFTLKHVQPSGHVELYPAARVAYQPHQRVGGPNGDVEVGEALFIESEKGEVRGFDCRGSFYVMNDAGKTVEKWHFPFGEIVAEQPVAA